MNYVQAKETTQKICLYLGQKITLADLPEGEVVLSKEHVVEVSANKVVTTIGAGTVTISVKTKAETVDYAEIEVKKNEILSDLSFNRQSFTAHPLGGGSFQLPIPQFESMTCGRQERRKRPQLHRRELLRRFAQALQNFLLRLRIHMAVCTLLCLVLKFCSPNLQSKSRI